MRTRVALGAFAVVALSMSGVMAGEGVKSGIKEGGRVSAFHPLNVTGPRAGQKNCLV
jgi:hypothetical protein